MVIGRMAQICQQTLLVPLHHPPPVCPPSPRWLQAWGECLPQQGLGALAWWTPPPSRTSGRGTGLLASAFRAPESGDRPTQNGYLGKDGDQINQCRPKQLLWLALLGGKCMTPIFLGQNMKFPNVQCLNSFQKYCSFIKIKRASLVICILS